jgi:hypothetical protein
MNALDELDARDALQATAPTTSVLPMPLTRQRAKQPMRPRAVQRRALAGKAQPGDAAIGRGDFVVSAKTMAQATTAFASQPVTPPARSSSPLTRVQRVESDEPGGADAIDLPSAESTDLSSSAMSSSPMSSSPSSLPEPPEASPVPTAPVAPDIHQIAKQVYPLIKRLLAVERERMSGR